jgi:methylated-DNA-protein-cysteine methyltransferase-like protein
MPRRARHVGWALHTLPDDLAWGAAGDIRRLAGSPASPGSPAPSGKDPAANAGGASPVPWHRVVNAQGRVSPHPDDYGTRRQIELLRDEGFDVADDGALAGGLDAHRWEPTPEELEGLELPPEVLFRLDPPDR